MEHGSREAAQQPSSPAAVVCARISVNNTTRHDHVLRLLGLSEAVSKTGGPGTASHRKQNYLGFEMCTSHEHQHLQFNRISLSFPRPDTLSASSTNLCSLLFATHGPASSYAPVHSDTPRVGFNECTVPASGRPATQRQSFAEVSTHTNCMSLDAGAPATSKTCTLKLSAVLTLSKSLAPSQTRASYPLPAARS